MIYLSEILPIRFYEVFDGEQFLPYKNQLSDELKQNEWLINEPIKLQIQMPAGYSFQLYEDYNDSNVLRASSSDETPVGWVGSVVYYLEYTPTEAREYKFFIRLYDGSSEIIKTLYADCLNVNYRLNDYVRIEYYNSENKDGIVYNMLNDTFNPVVFVRGSMINISNSGDFETMEDADGQTTLLKSTQKKIYPFNSWLLTNYQATMLSLITGLDRIDINGNKVVFEKPISIDLNEQTVSNNAEGEAIESDWDYTLGFEENISTATYYLLQTLKISSSDYYVNIRTSDNIRYSVNDSNLIEDLGTTRNVTINAIPDAEVKIYVENTISNKVTVISDTIVEANIHDLYNITSLTGWFSGCTKLRTATFDADTSSITNWSYLFNKCTSLSIVNGLTMNSFDAATTISNMCNDCYSLETFTINMSNTITSSRYAFNDCYNLKNIRGYIDTSNGDSVNFIEGCVNLQYPNYSIESLFAGSYTWWHPLDCDITLEMYSTSESFAILPTGSGLDFYISTLFYQTPSSVPFITGGGLNKLVGFNIPSACTNLKILQNYNGDNYDNIKSVIINNLRSVKSINDFIKGFKNISNFKVTSPLTSILEARSAFESANIAPNYFEVVNASDLAYLFKNNDSINVHIVNSSTLYFAQDMFSSMDNIINIYGTIDTTGAGDKSNMFYQIPLTLLRPSSAERTALTSASGAIYNY